MTAELKKDPGVPRLPDLKVKHALKHQPTRPSTSDGDVHMVPEPTLQTLALAEDQDEDLSIDHQSPAAHAKRQYLRTLYRVIDQADVVLLVLDARDPEGCRSRVIEDEVRRREPDGKRLMFVLNKVCLLSSIDALAKLPIR
jgi:nuclear GTP-binding protein